MKEYEQHCIGFSGVLSDETLGKIRCLGDGLAPEPGTVDSATQNHVTRCCTVAWIDDDAITAKVWDIAQSINQHFYKFELEGLESLQYTRYGVGGHYGWHMDKGPTTLHHRKLSFSVQLSHPDEYEGGELVVNSGSHETVIARTFGTWAAFPSYALHRVKPVTRGERRSLVVWAYGPAFR